MMHQNIGHSTVHSCWYQINEQSQILFSDIVFSITVMMMHAATYFKIKSYLDAESVKAHTIGFSKLSRENEGTSVPLSQIVVGNTISLL